MNIPENFMMKMAAKYPDVEFKAYLRLVVEILDDNEDATEEMLETLVEKEMKKRFGAK
jgi:hypothetical protein